MSRPGHAIVMALLLAEQRAGGQSLRVLETRLDSLGLAARQTRGALDAYRAAHPSDSARDRDVVRLLDGHLTIAFAARDSVIARQAAEIITSRLSQLGAHLSLLPSVRYAIAT